MSNEEFDPDVWVCANCRNEVHISDISYTESGFCAEVSTKCCGDNTIYENGDPVPFEEVAEAIGRRGE